MHSALTWLVNNRHACTLLTRCTDLVTRRTACSSLTPFGLCRMSTRAAPGRRPPPTALHATPPRTSTSPLPIDKMQPTVHTSTNDPHCRKPAHSRWAVTGGRPCAVAWASSGHSRWAVTGGRPCHRAWASSGRRPPTAAREPPAVQATRMSANSKTKVTSEGSSGERKKAT